MTNLLFNSCEFWRTQALLSESLCVIAHVIITYYYPLWVEGSIWRIVNTHSSKRRHDMIDWRRLFVFILSRWESVLSLVGIIKLSYQQRDAYARGCDLVGEGQTKRSWTLHLAALLFGVAVREDNGLWPFFSKLLLQVALLPLLPKPVVRVAASRCPRSLLVQAHEINLFSAKWVEWWNTRWCRSPLLQ